MKLNLTVQQTAAGSIHFKLRMPPQECTTREARFLSYLKIGIVAAAQAYFKTHEGAEPEINSVEFELPAMDKEAAKKN